jgi:GntP family gluconate:H+ symporter
MARAWIPLALPMLLILLGFLGDKARLIGNPSFALLLSALLCLALAWEKIQDIIHIASRRSGVILLDLCGAGAFGYVVAQSGIGEEIYGFGRQMPLLLLPFLVAAILQLAQGSRVVTVVVAAQVLASYPLDGLTLALLISSGAFMFSYVSDPYFWLIKSSTGANMGEVVKGYTLPLGVMGLASFSITAIYFLL